MAHWCLSLNPRFPGDDRTEEIMKRTRYIDPLKKAAAVQVHRGRSRGDVGRVNAAREGAPGDANGFSARSRIHT